MQTKMDDLPIYNRMANTRSTESHFLGKRIHLPTISGKIQKLIDQVPTMLILTE
jgi:hypothetical protein